MKLPHTITEMTLTVGGLTPYAEVALTEPASLTVEYDYAKGSPARMYLSNGDPGYPEEPEELDITSIVPDAPMLFEGEGISVTLHAGAEIGGYLTPLHQKALEQALLEDVAQDARIARDEAAEDRAERQREAREDAYSLH